MGKKCQEQRKIKVNGGLIKLVRKKTKEIVIENLGENQKLN